MRITGETLSLDELLMRPRRLKFSSRFNGDIDLSVEIVPGIRLKYPIVSANMDTVTEGHFAETIRRLGGLGIIHRFMDIDLHIDELKRVDTHRVLCVGVGRGGMWRFKQVCEEHDGFIHAVLIDVAHGHSNAVIDRIKEIKEISPDLPVIAGNVATPEGTLDLLGAGVDCIKCGVGPGSLCTTRIKTGCGVPQATAIMESREALERWWSAGNDPKRKFKPTIIADGGIKNSGDVLKCLALGANAVMIGSLFAGTDETPGRVVNFPGKGKMKEYRGMASREAQESWKGRATSVEGEMTYVPYKGPLETVFEELISGMLSGMAYQDATNVEVLQENVEFVKISTAGWKESLPHGVF